MKNIFAICLLFLLSFLIINEARAQNTEPIPTTFTILDNNENPSYRDLVKNPVNPVLRGEQVHLQAYSVEYGNAVDSIFYPATARLNMANSEGEIKYDFTLDSLRVGYQFNDTTTAVGSDSVAVFTVRKRTYRMDSTATTVVWLNTANRNVVDSLGFSLNNTASIGDKFRVVLTYDYLMSADNNGRLKVNSLDNILYQLDAENMFTVSVDSSLAGADDSLEIALITPSSNYLDIAWDVRASAKCWFYIKTGATLSVVTDTISIYNDDYGSTNTSGAVAIKAPRTSNTGTVKRTAKLINGTFSAQSLSRIKLGQSSTVVFGVASTAAADVTIELSILKSDGIE